MKDAELRAIAEKATPGPWRADESDPMVVWTGHEEAIGGLIAIGKCGMVAGDEYPRGVNHPAENMAHIAAWHPARTLAALDVIAAARDSLTYQAKDFAAPRRNIRAALARWQALEEKL